MEGSPSEFFIQFEFLAARGEDPGTKRNGGTWHTQKAMSKFQLIKISFFRQCSVF